MTDLIIDPDAPFSFSEERLTGRLRWWGRELQQEWSVLAYRRHKDLGLDTTRELTEWRTVPTESS